VQKKPKPEPHNFSHRVLHWPCCAKCGLIKLKNDTTDRAAKLPCSGD
jgi:hypothetical protein